MEFPPCENAAARGGIAQTLPANPSWINTGGKRLRIRYKMENAYIFASYTPDPSCGRLPPQDEMKKHSA